MEDQASETGDVHHHEDFALVLGQGNLLGAVDSGECVLVDGTGGVTGAPGFQQPQSAR